MSGGFSSDRLSYNNKRIWVKGYTIARDNMLMQITPKAGSYQDKGDSYGLSKNGYVVFDFLPLDESKHMDATKKGSFVLLTKNVGEILDLDTQMPYDESTDSEGSFIQYQPKPEDPIRVLKMTKLPKRKYRFQFCEVKSNGDEIANDLKMELTYGEIKSIQKLIEFSLPLLIGWHVMYNQAIVKN